MTTWILIASLVTGPVVQSFSSLETCTVAADLIIAEEDNYVSWAVCVME